MTKDELVARWRRLRDDLDAHIASFQARGMRSETNGVDDTEEGLSRLRQSIAEYDAAIERIGRREP